MDSAEVLGMRIFRFAQFFLLNRWVDVATLVLRPVLPRTHALNRMTTYVRIFARTVPLIDMGFFNSIANACNL